MKTLIYGAGPIGQWLALRLHQAGKDVTLLARNNFDTLSRDGIVIVDGLTGERLTARVPLVKGLGPDDQYDLVLVSPSTVFIGLTHPFPRRRLYQAAAVDGVEAVTPVYAYQQHFRNPWRHNTRNLLIVGVDPTRHVLRAPGIEDREPRPVAAGATGA